MGGRKWYERAGLWVNGTSGGSGYWSHIGWLSRFEPRLAAQRSASSYRVSQPHNGWFGGHRIGEGIAYPENNLCSALALHAGARYPRHQSAALALVHRASGAGVGDRHERYRGGPKDDFEKTRLWGWEPGTHQGSKAGGEADGEAPRCTTSGCFGSIRCCPIAVAPKSLV